MDDQTALILALQLVALSCIAAALLMYLLCRIRNRRANNDDQEGGDCGLDVGQGRAVLITSCDTVLGLQCALHLSWLGFRVFAGFKNVGEGDAENGTLAVKILKAKLKERETLVGENDGNLVANMGLVVPIPLDVTREDMLHEAVGLIRRHLPAGEDGLWAVVNTAGLCCRGRLEQQDNAHWDTTLKHNVIGTLRTARTFLPLLRNKKGRLLTLGMDVSRPDADAHSGLVAYTAARYAVEGASVALRHEIAAQDVRVITLHPEGLSTEKLFGVPSIGNTINQDTVVELGLSNNKYVEYDVSVLPSQAIRVIEEALLSKTPQDSYRLLPHKGLKSLAFSLRGVPDKLMCANAKNRHT